MELLVLKVSAYISTWSSTFFRY